MIDPPGRKPPANGDRVAKTERDDGAAGAPATTARDVASDRADGTRAASPRVGDARRVLERLGRAMSLRPTPPLQPAEQVAAQIAERAGRTPTLRSGEGGAAATTFAAIDLGSSSAKMLVVRREADGTLRTLVDVKIGAALGKDVAPGEDIPAENKKRALDALESFIKTAAEHGVDAADIPLITTAVVRNAPNGGDFVDAIHALGLIRGRVLSGEEEAAAGYTGALAMLKGADGEFATLDLGGGSFQLAIGTEEGMEAGGSTQVGSNIILDTLLTPAAGPDGAGDPAVFEKVDAYLKAEAAMPLPVERLGGRTLVATGGVSKFLRAHFGKDVIARDDIDALRRSIVALPYEARVAPVRGDKGADTQLALGIDTLDGAIGYGKKLPASASLLLHILDALGVDEVRVSETDARHVEIQRRIAELAQA